MGVTRILKGNFKVSVNRKNRSQITKCSHDFHRQSPTGTSNLYIPAPIYIRMYRFIRIFICVSKTMCGQVGAVRFLIDYLRIYLFSFL